MTTSEWFKLLTNYDRKKLVCLFFDIRGKVRDITDLERFQLFDEFLRVFDNEYHALKKTNRP
jgi:hypothetical protein